MSGLPTHVSQLGCTQPACDRHRLLAARGAPGAHAAERRPTPACPAAAYRPKRRQREPHGTSRVGTLYFDGGATPSPGLGGAGYWLLDDRNVEVARCAIGIYPYDGVTNNQAEYIALIQGMIKAQDEGMKRLVVKGDSEVIIYQMTGRYECHAERLVPLK